MTAIRAPRLTPHLVPRLGARLAIVAAAVLALSGCTSSSPPEQLPLEPAPPTSTGPIGAANVPLTTSIDVAGSRAALEAGHGEIRRILEAELGVDGWRETREAQEVACPSRADATGTLDDGIGKFYAAELRHPAAVTADRTALWNEIVRAVEPHGFRPKQPESDSPGIGEERDAPGEHYDYLINGHLDELTVSTHPEVGTGVGGFGVCHPWGD